MLALPLQFLLPNFLVKEAVYGLKNAVFWDVAPCRSCVNRSFGGTYHLHLEVRKNPRARNQRKQVAAATFAGFSTLKMEAIHSSEKSDHTKSTRRHIPEDGILHSHRRGNLNSYICMVSLSVYPTLAFVRKLMKSPCCLCVCVSPPPYFSFSMRSLSY
jgi:hypothetical protein